MSDAKQQPSAVERLLARAPRHEPEVAQSDVRKAFEEQRAPRSRGREAIMLDIRQKGGESHGLSYAYLVRVDFTPGDKLTLHFAGDIVEIEGRQLRDLYRRLLEHRVEAIQEGTEAEEGLKPEEAAHIERLQLLDKSEVEDDRNG